MNVYLPECLKPFPEDLSESLLEMALERTGIARERLDSLADDEKRRLDEIAWRLVTAADVSDTPCSDH